MKKDLKINLSPLDDLFTTEEQRQDNKLERVREIAIDELQPFNNHPFQVKNDEEMITILPHRNQSSLPFTGSPRHCSLTQNIKLFQPKQSCFTVCF